MTKTVLVLGAAGPAGSNFIQCLTTIPGPNNPLWRVIAADSNPYHLALLKGADEKVLLTRE